MTNISTATYIKKLVKMVYEKEKQIESLKKDLKDQCNSNFIGQKEKRILKEQKNSIIEDHIKTEVFQASAQLREVHSMMNAMEEKIADLEIGLQEETMKNQEHEAQIALLKAENAKLRQNQRRINQERRTLKQENSNLLQLLQSIKKDYSECTIKCAQLQQEMQQLKKGDQILKSEKHSLIVEIENIREEKSSLSKIESEKENLLLLKREMSQKISDYKIRQYEAQKKIRELTEQNERIQEYFLQVEIIKHQLNNQIEITKKAQTQLEEKKGQLQMKSNEYCIINEKLKDYEEFAFEISQYIESAFVKHCSQGTRSTKRLIKDGQSSNRFQYIFKKMTLVQNWMDNASQKLQKLAQQFEIPNETLDNLSHIMNSFEDKLKLCDLTEQLQLEKEQMIKNEEELIKNLQKQCEKSVQHERTKLVELGEVKEVLKMTKDVNRELMDQINRKEYIISECKKAYKTLIGNRSSSQYKNLKLLLDIKN